MHDVHTFYDLDINKVTCVVISECELLFVAQLIFIVKYTMFSFPSTSS